MDLQVTSDTQDWLRTRKLIFYRQELYILSADTNDVILGLILNVRIYLLKFIFVENRYIFLKTNQAL